MFKKRVLLLILFPYLLMAELDYRVDNTNFTISENSMVYNYDRLRFYADFVDANFFGTLIADGVNYYGNEYVDSNNFAILKTIESDTPFSTQTGFHDYSQGSSYAKLYRLYGGYEDEKNRVVAGLINITMGVGRVWNPTNLFNPKNSYALEPDEVFGVAGVSYTRYINDTSNVTGVVSQRADHSFQYAGMYKTFIDTLEIGLNVVKSNDTQMIGYEIESNLYDSGVEVRSEGTYIENDTDFFQGILGADYGFLNGITLVAEALYSSKKFSYQERILNIDSEIASNLVGSNLYTALSLSYGFNIFLDGSLLYIESFNDKNSRFISPSLTYTLNDYNILSLGAMVQDGSAGSEFGSLENSYYFKWALSF